MLSTDPNNDNRTIASTLKMQIRIAMNNKGAQGDENEVSGYGYGLIPPHIFEVGLKVNTKSVPGCAEECGDPLV